MCQKKKTTTKASAKCLLWQQPLEGSLLDDDWGCAAAAAEIGRERQCDTEGATYVIITYKVHMKVRQKVLHCTVDKYVWKNHHWFLFMVTV